MGYDPIKLVNRSNADILKDAEAARLQNELVKQWAPKVRTALASSATRFSHGKTVPFILRPKKGAEKEQQKEGKLAKSLKVNYKELYGEIYGISFKFERHGVFVYKGVGRYGTKNRTPADWFNPVIIQNLPELANRLAEIRADAVLNAGKLLIP